MQFGNAVHKESIDKHDQGSKGDAPLDIITVIIEKCLISFMDLDYQATGFQHWKYFVFQTLNSLSG